MMNIQLDSVSLAFHPDWSEAGIWEVKCYVQDPPTTDFYRFLITKNAEMLTDTIDEWFVTDDRFFNGNYAYGAPIAYLQQHKNDEVLFAGDTVKVEMNSIGRDYANFIWEAQTEAGQSNPLFSGPPSNVKGNIFSIFHNPVVYHRYRHSLKEFQFLILIYFNQFAIFALNGFCAEFFEQSIIMCGNDNCPACFANICK
jgi:hypothetical protein